MTEEKGKNYLLTIKMGKVKAELVDYQAGVEGHWTKKKKAFLESPEFFDLLANRLAFLFKHRFEGVI